MQWGKVLNDPILVELDGMFPSNLEFHVPTLFC